MLNRVYRLVAPRTIEPVETCVPLEEGTVVVRPTHLSICNADMRYWLGRRPAEVLARKLPMALIHEGIGRVVYDPSEMLASGTQVVMVPNEPAPAGLGEPADEIIAENYRYTSRFRGSGFDGFMQELVALPARCAVPLPEGLDPHVAAFTEIVSVAVHAATRFDAIAHERRGTIGVWGDGNMGLIVSLVLRILQPESHIVVFGRSAYKLADFTFADATYLTDAVPAGLEVDHAFECCGGEGSASAIAQIISCIRPEGTISLLGVSENPPAIDTRMVLEKGLRLFGSSRSGLADFERTVELYRAHPEVPAYLQALVGDVICVRGVRDMAAAFDADLRKPMGKTIMEWNV